MEGWFVVYTKPKKEREAEQHLRQQEYETRLPLLEHTVRRGGKWRNVIEPLFPRYLFVRLRLGADNIGPIRSTRGVSNLVRFGTEPTPLPSGFIEALDAKSDEKGLHRQESLTFQRGDLVSILDGPFAGCTARYEFETEEGRVSLLLDLLGRSNKVIVKRDLIVPHH